MANILSPVITNLDATPAVSTQNQGARVRVKTGHCVSAAGDSNGDVYRFVRVSATDRILSIQCYNDAIANGSDYNCGLYETAANGGADKDENCYADAVTLVTICPAIPHVVATAPFLELRFGVTGTADILDVEQRVFEDAGDTLASDGSSEYDLCLTGVAVGDGGDITLVVYYTDGS